MQEGREKPSRIAAALSEGSAAAADGNLEPLWSLLRGDGLFEITPGTPSTAWLLREMRQDPGLRAGLVDALPRLIDAAAGRLRSPDWRGAVYALIDLCTYVRNRENLGPPLEALYRKWRASGFRFEYSDLDIREPLRAALANNQQGKNLVEDWKAGLEAGYDGYLPLGMAEALRGIVLMEREVGQWPKQEIGAALGKIALRIEERPEETRSRVLLGHLDYVYNALGPIPDWGFERMDMARIGDWPQWAVHEPGTPIVEAPGSPGQFLVTMAIARSLQNHNHSSIVDQSGAHVWIVDSKPNVLPCLRELEEKIPLHLDGMRSNGIISGRRFKAALYHAIVDHQCKVATDVASDLEQDLLLEERRALVG